MITLQIERTGGAQLGNCYYAHYYKIKSLNQPLDKEKIDSLHELGLLGYGQEFYCDYKNTEEKVDGDKYPYNRYFVVKCERRVDSSD